MILAGMSVSGNPCGRRLEKKEVFHERSSSARVKRYCKKKRAVRANKTRKNHLAEGVYPVAGIVRLRVKQALFGRGERI
ncbi:protein of unknown function [Nitrospira japonica]|uniref:Uncharacterized protein n=1 Tax=Nitrospira japonica TaxID=1325564 RepID=A0A1W1I619_9BACT|nr:protein of unknown function [Nitrospira japonica]